jgi:type I restriction enzyme S subunit
MIEGWKETTLGEVAEIVKDQWLPGDADQKYIGLEHINQGDLQINSFGCSSSLQSNKFYFKQGDILFGKLRPYFRKVWKARFDGVCSTDIWVLRAKEGYDQNYLFYFMANPVFIDKSTGASIGTKMPRADWDFLKRSKWLFPPLSEQRAIAAILSSFDDKIELLRRQNKTLEAIAQAIFKEWFVKFKVKGEQLKLNPKTGLPEGWRMGKLEDVIEIYGGGTPKTDIPEYWNGDIPWFSVADVPGEGNVYVIECEKHISKQGLENSSTKVLPRNTTIITARGTVGKLALTGVPMAMNQSCYGIAPKDRRSFFYFYLLMKESLATLKQQVHGAVFDTITRDTLNNISTIIPASEVLKDLHIAVKPMFQKVLQNNSQIQTLSKLRDTLLPKLMKGEIRVKREE